MKNKNLFTLFLLKLTMLFVLSTKCIAQIVLSKELEKNTKGDSMFVRVKFVNTGASVLVFNLFNTRLIKVGEFTSVYVPGLSKSINYTFIKGHPGPFPMYQSDSEVGFDRNENGYAVLRSGEDFKLTLVAKFDSVIWSDILQNGLITVVGIGRKGLLRKLKKFKNNPIVLSKSRTVSLEVDTMSISGCYGRPQFTRENLYKTEKNIKLFIFYY